MGKATIYEHLGGGKYRVLYQRNNGRAKDRVRALEKQKVDLDEQLFSGPNSLINAQSAAQTEYDRATGIFSVALDNWAACAAMLPPCSYQGELMAAVMEAGQARSDAGLALTTIKNVIAENRSQYFAVTQEIAYLANTAKTSADGEVIQVWCVDYAPDNIIPVNTVVGTIETFGARRDKGEGWLPRPYINIRTSAEPAYSASRDKCATPLSSQGVGTLFFNYMQWLYVMANNPLHAVGTVLSKYSPDQAWLDIELFGNTPPAVQPINYPFVKGANSITLINVPVSYLSCGARAFVEGDRVVVRFGGVNRTAPVVIGFASNPFPCAFSSVVVRALFAGLPATETRVLKTTTCATEFNAHAVPTLTSIGWLDWIDDTGEAALWIQVGGSLGKYRYGRFLGRNPGKRTIYRRREHAITVAADIFGLTKYNGAIYYVTRTDAGFELRDTAENILASYALNLAGQALMLDGWFKFSVNGADGVSMTDTQHYLLVHLATDGEGAVTATITLQDAPAGVTFDYSTTAVTIHGSPWSPVFTGESGPTIYAFCPDWYRNLYTGTSRAWAADYIGNDLRFLYIEGYTEFLTLGTTSSGCTDHISCFYRKEQHQITRYRIGAASSDFQPDTTVGVLRTQKTDAAGTHVYDWVPAMDGVGSMTLTDLDIRRSAAAFTGTAYTVTGTNTADISTNAVFVVVDEERRVENIADDLTGITFSPTPIDSEGGFFHGGGETPEYQAWQQHLVTGDPYVAPSETCATANYSNTSTPTAINGTNPLPFTGTARAELFTLSNSDTLFFARGGAGPYTYSHARFCSSAFSDITSLITTMPENWGYQS